VSDGVKNKKPEVEGGLLSIDVITQRYNKGRSGKFHITNNGMGKKLRVLGFTGRSDEPQGK